jgi:hypothetical protein
VSTRVITRFESSVNFCNTVSNQNASSFISAHIYTMFCPIGVFADRLKRAPGHDAQLTEVHEVFQWLTYSVCKSLRLFWIRSAAVWMVQTITYSPRHYIDKNHLDTCIVATVRTSDLIISCDSSSFKKTHILRSTIFRTLRPAVNSGKEVGSTRMVIVRHCVSCR